MTNKNNKDLIIDLRENKDLWNIDINELENEIKEYEDKIENLRLMKERKEIEKEEQIELERQRAMLEEEIDRILEEEKKEKEIEIKKAEEDLENFKKEVEWSREIEEKDLDKNKENDSEIKEIKEEIEKEIKEELEDNKNKQEDILSQIEKDRETLEFERKYNEAIKKDKKEWTSFVLKLFWILSLIIVLAFIACYLEHSYDRIKKLNREVQKIQVDLKWIQEKLDWQEIFNESVREYVKEVDWFMRDSSLEFDRFDKMQTKFQENNDFHEKMKNALREVYFPGSTQPVEINEYNVNQH